MNLQEENFIKAPGNGAPRNASSNPWNSNSPFNGANQFSMLPTPQAHGAEFLANIPMIPYFPPNAQQLFPQYDYNSLIRYLQNLSVAGNMRSDSPSGNTTIQIGYQCFNNNASVPDVSMPNAEVAHSHSNSSLNSNKTQTESISKRLSPVVDYDTPDIPIISSTQLKPEQLTELTRMALRGCEKAEQLANNHKKRPCFKKIDSLCARMKQDLVRPDNVLANINSQGIAWAVKDFIFVFTRIINAWLIIKGYVYNTPDGLGNVKSALSANFNESYAKWQDATMDFVDNLIKSFMNLDQLVQNQRVSSAHTKDNQSYTAMPNHGSESSSSTLKSEDFEADVADAFSGLKNNFSAAQQTNKMNFQQHTTTTFPNIPSQPKPERDLSFSIVENSEATQRKHFENGTYLKTGIYAPLLKDLNNNEMFESFSNNEVSDHREPKKLISTTSTPKIIKNQFSNNIKSDSANFMMQYNQSDDSKTGATSKDTTLIKDMCEGTTNKHQAESIRKIEKNNLDLGLFNDAVIRKTFDPTIVKKIEYLLQRICSLDAAQYFFAVKFTKNYFPDFHTIVPKFIDIRSIILKTQIGGYKNIYEIVYDLRQIIFSGKYYLQIKPNDLLSKSITAFENELDQILAEDAFVNYGFSRITGSPNEHYISE